MWRHEMHQNGMLDVVASILDEDVAASTKYIT